MVSREEFDLLQQRLATTEAALVGLWGLIRETFPPAYAEDADRLMRQYFDKNVSLGADFETSLRVIANG